MTFIVQCQSFFLGKSTPIELMVCEKSYLYYVVIENFHVLDALRQSLTIL